MTVVSALLFLELNQQILLFPSAPRFNLACSWLRHCATSRKMAGFFLDKVIETFYSIDPGIDLACNRNEYQMYPLGTGG